MKFCLVYIVVLSNLTFLLSTVAFENPFTETFVGIIDQTLDVRTTTTIDLDLTYFKDYLKLNDAEINLVLASALNFFNHTYGLDFSLPSPGQYLRFFEKAVFAPIKLREEVKFYVSIIKNGTTDSYCSRVYDGAFGVTFSSDQTLHGSYGGIDGKPVGNGDFIFYGFYQIPMCEESPLLIQYQSVFPARQDPIDSAYVVASDIYNRVLGHGNSNAVFFLKPDENEPGQYRITYRNVFTFPGIE